MDSPPRANRARAQPERALQNACKILLRLRGFAEPGDVSRAHDAPLFYVLGTTRRDGDWRGTMQTRGLPDMLIECPRGTLIGIELKSARGRLTPEQRVGVARGLILVVRSVAELAALLDARRG